MPLFRRILVANRSEIAVRVMQTCRDMGIDPVAVHSTVDATALHVALATQSVEIGPSPARQSYLSIEKLIDAARATQADAIHPGYGFLSESADFADACRAAGIAFIGPSAAAIAAMGSKIAARQQAERLGIPTVAGVSVALDSLDSAVDAAERVGYPIVIKAAAGGGGRGIKIVRAPAELADALAAARREGASYFGSDAVFLERYLPSPRHVEVQVIADHMGTTIALGERDCSIQRSHQKVVEETPAPDLNPTMRQQMAAAAVALARSIGYSSVGTVEFLVADGAFYFLEMNTRIQVEHTVTEMVWGLDLVAAQIRIAAGLPLSAALTARDSAPSVLESEAILHHWISERQPNGHAIQCRINAEDPTQGWRPAAGRVTMLHLPTGHGVRVDSALYPGYTIPPDYDSLAAKLITWGQTRDQARRRMARALHECVLEGIATTMPLLRHIMADATFAAGGVTTRYLSDMSMDDVSLVPTLTLAESMPSAQALAPVVTGQGRTFQVHVGERPFTVRVAELLPERTGNARQKNAMTRVGGQKAGTTTIQSPLHGAIVRLMVTVGEHVRRGQVVCVVEAMKMENDIFSPTDGRVTDVFVGAGSVVELDASLVTIVTDASEAPV